MKMNALCAKIGRVFKTENGALRPAWRTIFGVIAYFAAFYVVLYGLAAIFGALFDAWGLTNDNLALAPNWARRIVYSHTDFCYAAAYLVSSGAGLWIARRNEKARRSLKAIWIAMGVGLAMSAGLTLIAFAMDSVRLERPLGEPHFSVQTLIAFFLIAIGKFSHEVLCRRLIYAQLRAWKASAVLVSSAVTAILIGEWTVCGAISGILVGMVACALYERGGLIASAAMQTVWTAWCALVFGFPGMNVNANPVYAVYHVSDAWLTGGNGSVLGGAWCALVAAIACIILYRTPIQNGIARLKARCVNIRGGRGTK